MSRCERQNDNVSRTVINITVLFAQQNNK